MNAIRIRKKIDSETLHIPELKAMMGQEVEIVVREAPVDPLEGVDTQAFWTSKTVDQLAAEQGVGPLTTLKSPVASQFTPEDWEGFEQALEEWRRER
jgi:hypothetical protein